MVQPRFEDIIVFYENGLVVYHVSFIVFDHNAVDFTAHERVSFPVQEGEFRVSIRPGLEYPSEILLAQHGVQDRGRIIDERLFCIIPERQDVRIFHDNAVEIVCTGLCELFETTEAWD